MMPQKHTAKHYQEVADVLRKQIKSGKLQPSERLKTERDLSEEFAVSRVTIRRALRLLEEERLVRRIQGSGTYVNPSSLRRIPLMIDYTGTMRSHSPNLQRKVVRLRQTTVARDDILALLKLKPEDNVLAVIRTDYANDAAIAYDEGFIPVDYAKGLTVAEFSQVAFIETWTRVCNFDIHFCNQTIEAIASTPESQTYLGLPTGSPILKSTEVYFSNHNFPVGIFISYYHPEHICISTRYNWQHIQNRSVD